MDKYELSEMIQKEKRAAWIEGRAAGTAGVSGDSNPYGWVECAMHLCQREAVTYGVCGEHAHIRTNNRDKTDSERFWGKVSKGESCWLWIGVINNKGYGALTLQDKTRTYAHRHSYQIHKGDIPEGYVIDHLCHTRRCVNPEHLRSVTRKQNQEHRKGADRDSQTGVRGVYPLPDGRYVAQAAHKHVGYFDTLEQAGEAVRLFRLEHMTHSDKDRVT